MRRVVEMYKDSTNNVLKSLQDISDVIENDSSMIIKNPVLGDVVFSNGTFGNLQKKNNGGFGIKHIIEGRYRKDGFSQEQIASLLYLIKETVETVSPSDIAKPKINLEKNGIWVGITRSWLDTDENWIITGYGEFNKGQQLTKEATDAINAVSAKYGYTPEFLSVGKQVGAVIASVNMITLKNQMSSVNMNITQLAEENARLKEENIRLGKQVFEYQKEKLLTQKSSANKHTIESKKPKDKSYGYER